MASRGQGIIHAELTAAAVTPLVDEEGAVHKQAHPVIHQDMKTINTLFKV